MTVYTYIVKAKFTRLGTLTTGGILKANDEYQAICNAVREGTGPFEKAGVSPDKVSVEVTAHPEIHVS